MGCLGRWKRSEAFALIRSAYPYRRLPLEDFNDALNYLAGGGESLRRQYTDVFGKIRLDEEHFETISGRVQRDLLQNIGVIPTEGMVAVRLKSRTLGRIEETFVRQLSVGDSYCDRK